MTIIENILACGEFDQVFRIPTSQLIDSQFCLPADWMPANCNWSCSKLEYHYQCVDTLFKFRWSEIFDRCLIDREYVSVFNSIKINNFVYPISAVVGYDKKHIAIADGHNRIRAALDLRIRYIPVYLSNSSTKIIDVVSKDSGKWRGNLPITSHFDPLPPYGRDAKILS